MRGRIRTIKPELFMHEELFDLEQEIGLPARLAFVGLWCFADRDGRFKWRPRTLGASILPYDTGCDFSKVLDGLEAHGFIARYTVNGTVYGVVNGFLEHQRPSRDEPSSDIPDPSGRVIEYVTPPNEKQRQAIYELDGHRCAYCGTSVGGEHSRKRCLDHVIPYAQGGSNTAKNLTTSCKRCNATKADKTPDQAGIAWPTRGGQILGEHRDNGSWAHRKPPVDEPYTTEGKGREPNGTEGNQGARVVPFPKFDSNDLEKLFSEMRVAADGGSYSLKRTDYDRAQQAVDWCKRERPADPAAACRESIARFLEHATGKEADGWPFWAWANDPGRWHAFKPGGRRAGESPTRSAGEVSTTFDESHNPDWAT